MMNRRAFIVTGLSVLALGGCNPFAVYTLRYRLKLIVSADGKTYEGSSVIKVSWRDMGRLADMTGGSLSSRAWGEAVVVDLGERGLLFGLLSKPPLNYDYYKGMPVGVLARQLSPEDREPADFNSGAIYGSIKKVRGEIELLPSDWPMLVRFRDINDPKTVEEVDPNDLAATFGPDVMFERATIQVTKDAITQRIEKYLPWFNEMTNGYLDGSRVSNKSALANQLSTADFRKWGF